MSPDYIPFIPGMAVAVVLWFAWWWLRRQDRR